ncbi:helix-turn-helix domain-containing protein [Catenulispora yoronensis]
MRELRRAPAPSRRNRPRGSCRSSNRTKPRSRPRRPARTGRTRAAAARAGEQFPSGLTDSQVLGRRLALARQQAGLSIEEVAAATRIRPGMVREIEAGDFIHCGGDVYARGHVRAIAKSVGVDPEPLIEAHPPVVPTELPARPRSRIVARADQAAGKPGGQPGDSGKTAQPASSSGSSSESSSPTGGATAGPADGSADGSADGAAGASTASRPASAAVPTSAARDNAARFAARVPSRVIRPAAEGATLRISTNGYASAGTGTGTSGPGSGSLRPPQPGRKDDPGTIERHPKSANWTAAMLVALLGLVVFAGVQLVGGDGDKHAAALPAPAPKPAVVAPPPAPAPPPVPKDVEVSIAAVGADSWLNVTGADGRVIFDSLLPAGGTQSFKDAKQLGVTLGNASAVHMNLNGKDLGPAGGQGQVVHWTLNPTGAVNS